MRVGEEGVPKQSARSFRGGGAGDSLSEVLPHVRKDGHSGCGSFILHIDHSGHTCSYLVVVNFSQYALRRLATVVRGRSTGWGTHL